MAQSDLAGDCESRAETTWPRHLAE